jgi:hypothetical protein
MNVLGGTSGMLEIGPDSIHRTQSTDKYYSENQAGDIDIE